MWENSNLEWSTRSEPNTEILWTSAHPRHLTKIRHGVIALALDKLEEARPSSKKCTAWLIHTQSILQYGGRIETRKVYINHAEYRNTEIDVRQLLNKRSMSPAPLNLNFDFSFITYVCKLFVKLNKPCNGLTGHHQQIYLLIVHNIYFIKYLTPGKTHN